MNYLQSYSTRRTAQSEAIPGSSQVENSAGGFAWAVDDWTRLRRFLILGAEGGSYYATERKLTKENGETVMRCLQSDGPRTVNEIVQVSVAGNAPKNDPALFALAMACASKDAETRKCALDAIPQVCRVGTHLFHFAQYVEQFRGWGRGLRRAISAWYEQPIDKLAYQVVKYRQRDGWAHRDLLRLAHPEAPSVEHRALYDWICRGGDHAAHRLIEGYERAQKATPKEAARLITDYGLPREALNPDHLTDPVVWEALLENMPMTAMIRNLATMTRIGLLAPLSKGTTKVIEQLRDEERLRKARVHPIQVLAAMLTYASGRGMRGTNTWTPVVQIVDALDAAFYASFGNVESTGKRYMLGLDVSGSMDSGVVAGVPGLTPRMASSAMALVTAKSESAYEAIAFTSTNGGYSRDTALMQLPLSPRQRLDDVCNMTNRLPFGGTDCSLPIIAAQQSNREVDVFVIYTDSETWAGSIHPSQALQAYRQQSGIDAKLIVVGMVSNGFSIADPNDIGMLDVVGFDTSAPNLMAEFARGNV